MLQNVHFDEAKQSQLKCVELLLNMGYLYVSRDEVLRQRGGNTSNFILTDIAAQKLMEINQYEVGGESFKFTEKDVRDAIHDLEHVPYEGLIDTSQTIYNMIMPTSGGKTITVSHGGKKSSHNFKFIDFVHPERNAFHVTVEYEATGKQTVRPDIVCFINGIPFVVIENKKSSVSIKEALKDLTKKQGAEYCPKLFTYAQMLIGTNGKELQYGTTGTPGKFYAVWKEKGMNDEDIEQKILPIIGKPIDTGIFAEVCNDLNGNTKNITQYTSRLVTEQDKGIVFLLEPKRLLDLTKNYMLFDAGVKKISRYQQYFGISKMLHRVEEFEETTEGIIRRKGGIVWHTQGSGKSLTMVMFVKALIEDPDIKNPRIIVVTDRKDLDQQIRDTFKNCNVKKNVTQATSGQHLLDLIQEKTLDVVTTLVHKFDTAAKKRAGFVDDDKNLFVLVDEAHRSQYGDTADQMRLILRNACFIGFTGTPLLKKDKSRTKFGELIDRYTIDDALADGVVLPLVYEGRYVDTEQNAAQIDKHLERAVETFAEKNPGNEPKISMQKEITAKIIQSNPQRMEEIGRDIESHFIKNFQGTGLKAQAVAPSKYAAVVLQKYFETRGNVKTAVVISDEPEKEDEFELEDRKKEVIHYLKKIKENYSGVEKYEKDVVDSFKKNDDGIEIIIVVDKLLTGFDAPRNTVLYLAKDLKDHTLLQAIARVNRLYENEKLPKTFGYVIDYSENAKNIDTAMKLFGNYDEDDVKGTLIDTKEKITELEQSYGLVQDLFREIKGSSDDEEYLRFLGDEPTRQSFYKAISSFVRNMNECYVLQDFVHQFKDLDLYKRELKKLLELRGAANLRYADNADLGEYRKSLIAILDKYVDAKEVELLTEQVVITDRAKFDEAVDKFGSDASKAEAIAAQTERTIQEKVGTDPEFYMRFSAKIHEILQQMRIGKLQDIEALKQLKLIRDDVVSKKDDELPQVIGENNGAAVFYRNLREKFERHGVDEDAYIAIILELFNLVKHEAIVDWYKNADVKRKISNVIDDYLYDTIVKEKGVSLSAEEMRELVGEIIRLAEYNPEHF